MKPIKIRMRYFGPYVDQTIDFREFSDAPVFLISGKTGAGKTTIFDAMCFALFGRTSGDERAAEQMRSDFAAADDLTEVTFVFDDQQRRYQITRSPKQTVTAKHGNKTTTRTAKVSLIYIDAEGEKKEITKINQANQFINDLLNLTAEQFSQIVLLPQGQFRNFLVADSNQKEAVLRELFGTGFYRLFVDDISEKAKARHRASEQELLRLRSLQANAKFERPEDNNSELPVLDWLETLQKEIERKKQLGSKYQEEYQRNEERKTQLNRTYQMQQTLLEDQQELVRLQKQAAELEQQKPQIIDTKKQLTELEWGDQQRDLVNERLSSSRLVQELQDQQKLKRAEQGRVQIELERLRAELKEIERAEPQINEFQGQIERLKAKVDLYQEVEKLAKQHDQLTEQVQQTKRSSMEAQLAITTDTEEIDKLTAKLAGYQDLQQQGVEVQKQQDQATDLKQQMLAVKASLQEQTETEKKLQKLKQDASVLSENARQAQRKYDQLEQKYTSDQIVILASRLKPGTPCPLCGSTEHPHPAELTMQAQPTTKEEVDRAQQTAQAAYGKLHSQNGTIQTQTQFLTEKKERLLAQQTALAERIGLDPAAEFSEIEATLGELEKKQASDQKSYAQRLEQSKKLNDRLVSLRQKRPILEQQSAAASESYHQTIVEEQKVLTEYKQKQQQLPSGFGSSTKLSEQLERWQQQVAKHRRKKEEYQEKVNSGNSQLAALTAGIKERTERQDQAKKHEQAALSKLQERVAAYEGPMDLTRLEELCTQLDQIPQLRKKVQDYQEKCTINQTSQKQLQARISGRPKPDIAATSAQIAELDKAQNELFQQRSAVVHLYQGNQDVFDQVKQILEKYQQTLKESQQWDQLAEVVAGKGKLKLNIERYVLQSYFKQVLEVANQRFSDLTGGRYGFVLDEGHGSYASNTGLELNIYDDNAGKIRSVHTLSGGESFIAALCLALALGEVVSAQAGGIFVEALFIDEGFGSLDQDSLQVALDALKAIEGENRLIGIISHVSELRSEIPDQLHVISSHGRSSIRYDHEFD
ncbi:exonuclease SbcC [Ligilactobacillus salitolerans]|uniref:Nuclease SbcCD subunit C n=1 Tax=Ligilactobacillus salitolerans TaxID=1808352 RepID=A0A401IVT0_9LACO|nr:SMC family ATPase [Ligilactobacillus salitolerans]GBG95615.1 exonuclease SbcC [Ligilactobacillus salitolerans]